MQYVNKDIIPTFICIAPNSASYTKPVFIIGASCDNTNWYRELSDGTIIQGGYVSYSSEDVGSSVSVYYNKPYTTSDIAINLTAIFTEKPTAGFQGGFAILGDVTNSSFCTCMSGSSSRMSGFYWEAKGI